MKIPKGYKLIKINTGGEGSEYRYLYADSSMIYLSDANGLETVNDNSVRKQKVNYSTKSYDSILWKGVNSDGNYWMEGKYKELLYGYINVKPEKKILYDNALQSIKYK